MVFLTKVLLMSTAKRKKPIRKYLQSGFLDSLRIYVRGGAGGNGLPKFGGVGGQGGSVIAIAKENIESLDQVIRKHPKKRVAAGHGHDSTHNFVLGPPGEDVEIEVPVGVTIVTDHGKLLGELNNDGDKVVVAKGGTAGHPKNGFLGTRGEEYPIKLDLKLIADIGLVGFPNAGKSTFLKAVSHAKPKIANYPFTTIKPNVGIMSFKDLRQISVADLPGLIEGAHRNRGMGHQFLKHVDRTKLVLLIVDVSGFQLSPQHLHRTCFENIVLLNKELEMYKPELTKKPTALVINKMDVDGAAEKFKVLENQLKNIEEHVAELPSEFKPETLLNFQEIFAISARNGSSDEIDYVKKKLRLLLDLNAPSDETDKDDEAQHTSTDGKRLIKEFRDSLKEKGPSLV